MSQSAPVAVELCAGMGGIGIGLRALGFVVAKAYDAWDDAVAIYNANAPEQVAAKCNLLAESGRQKVKAGCGQLGDIDLLAAGPPCKGFSQLRNGRHDGRNGHNRVLAAMPDYVALLCPHGWYSSRTSPISRGTGRRSTTSR
jgi:DNA (cytosine-5)-methyltransferase 1